MTTIFIEESDGAYTVVSGKTDETWMDKLSLFFRVLRGAGFLINFRDEDAVIEYIAHAAGVYNPMHEDVNTKNLDDDKDTLLEDELFEEEL